MVTLAVGAVLGLFAYPLTAQQGTEQNLPEPRYLVDHFPEKPSLAPTFKIPLDPLGFAAPGGIYLGARNSLVSLDFLDEDHLLFSFRVPGLIHRDPKGGAESDERRIRALVLRLPQGRVEAEALWTVHDRMRYVWPLKDGHFLLRDSNTLFESDATLKQKPYLDFPGPLLWLDLDPSRQHIVATSEEPTKTDARTNPPSSGAQNHSTAIATGTTDDAESGQGDGPDKVVRVLRRDSGEVMLVSRARDVVHLPVNSTGYLENLRDRSPMWTLNFHYFAGGSKMLGSVASGCDPEDNFLSENEILIQGCDDEGAQRLVAMTTEGRTLWITQAPDNQVWPQLTVAANGSRFAWTTLDTAKSLSSVVPMDSESVKEQSVTVFDAATGDIPLVAPLSPIFDAGGNVAISPSGRRVALIDGGAIQVFDLPAVGK
ncbi:MAG: hypothetical protein WBP85_17105 [Terracidiphilus sp.]